MRMARPRAAETSLGVGRSRWGTGPLSNVSVGAESPTSSPVGGESEMSPGPTGGFLIEHPLAIDGAAA